MRKAAVAEWILSLFVSPERASAVVGDLTERGAGLWFTVLRIAASSISRDLWDGPGPLIFLAVQAIVLDAAAMFLGARFRWSMLAPYQLGAGSCIGLWLAWRAPGREMAAVAAFFLMGWVAGAAMYATVPGVSLHFTWPIQETALLITVMAARRRRLRHA
jgi:hypothetical protein